MKRRLLSALLAMAMLLTMVPAAFAVDNEPGGETGTAELLNTTEVSLTVGGKKELLEGKGVNEEGHTWTLSEGGEKYVSLKLYEGKNAHYAQVGGIAGGTAILTHTWGENEENKEIYNITVTGFTVADALEQISAELAETVTLPVGMDSLDAAFTLNAYTWGNYSGDARWRISSKFDPVSLKADLEPGDEPVYLTTVDATDASVDLNADTYTCYVVSFDDPDGEGNLESTDVVCFKVQESKITFYYMEENNSSLPEVPNEKLAEATTITVGGSYPTDFEAYIQETNEHFVTLQRALDAVEDGETIVLCKDLTDVAVTVEKSINSVTLDLNDHTISGKQHPISEGSSSTTPQPENSTPAAITIGSNATGAGEADQPEVGRFTLKNGTVSVGTGLRLYDDLTTLTVENVIFKDNVASNAKQKEGGAVVDWRASDEAAVTVGGTSATFVNCKFQNNKSEYFGTGNPNGGAVMISNVETVSFTGCTFTGNTSTGTNTSNNSVTGTGGAVYSDYCGSVTFTGCDFSGNSAASASGGGAVYMQINGTASFTDCKFTENKALAGAGGAIGIILTGSEGNNVTVSGCTFTGNEANYGGAMWLYGDSTMELTNNTIDSNSGTYGGAIYTQLNANVILTGDVTNNQASYGGAIYSYQSTLEVTGDITQNHASYGGAIYSSNTYLTVNGDITGNTADTDGGAIYCSQFSLEVNGDISGNTAGGNGGGIWSRWSPVKVTGSVTGNSADIGGGVYTLQNEYGTDYSGPIDLTGASVYNNTATTAAADIYSGADNTLKIGEVGSNWSLNSCGHLIDGWYSDAAGARWDADNAKENVTAVTAGTITEQTALIAAHGTDAKAAQTVTITPADIVIYTGGTGYSGVTVNEDGIIVSDPTESGLPEPGYHLELSPDVESWLQEQTQDQGAEDLSQYLTFTYQGTDGQGGTTSREWALHNAGIYDADAETGATTQYVYTLDPATVGSESIPVRILYFEDANDNGKYDEGETVRENDAFPMDENIVYNTYAMTINPGKLDQGQIKAEFTVGGETLTCNVAIGTGDLMVKSVDEPEYTNIAANQDAVLGDNIVAVPNETVNFYVNDSDVAIDNTENRVKLLVDDVSNNDAFNNALGEAATKKVTGLDNVKFAAQYLDLVDTANGNAVVTLGDGQNLSLYWPVPSDAADDSAFHIVHYTNMDRTVVTGTDDLDKAAVETQEGERVTIDGKDYIKFETGSFSPFVLVYEGKSSSGGGTTRYTLTYESNGGTEYSSERYTRNTVVELDKVPTREGYTFTGWYADKELTDRITEIKMTSNKTVYAGWEITGIPEWLNGDDHFAYVIGYEDGTVRPESNISRAEVATIFFRLLDPEIREENLTDENTFADVGKGVWYNQAISTMAALGIVNGRTDTAFEPDAPITRAEFAAICARFDTNKRDGDSNFTDISGHWAEAEIERAATLGWINGYEDGTFRPDAEITRAEAMTLINRVLQRLPETADDLLDDMTVWPDCQPNAWYYLAVQEATNSHDFDRKDDGVHESWTALTEDPDWEQYQ